MRDIMLRLGLDHLRSGTYSKRRHSVTRVGPNPCGLKIHGLNKGVVAAPSMGTLPMPNEHTHCLIF